VAFDDDLVPLDARRQLELVPEALRRKLASPWGRAVIRDWAEEHDLITLRRALAPARLFPYAVDVVVSHLQVFHEFEVRRESGDSYITLVLRLADPAPGAWEQEGGVEAMELCHDALWRIGLQPTGLDEIDTFGVRTVGWEPRVPFEKL
jgi:hypothetical protein